MKHLTQTEMTQSTQGKFYHFLDSFRTDFSVPEYKAIRDITRGILASGSAIVYQSAKELRERTRTKKTAERFYRNLKRPGLDGRIRERLLELQCRKINADTVIVVDESDIVKSCAQNMEGLKHVRDGSTGRIAPGYNLLNIIACQPDEQGYQIRPLSSDLTSENIEPDSRHNLLLDRITDITIHSGNRGTFVFDRGFDAWRVIDGLVSNDNAFIIRSTGQRHFEVNGKLKPIQAIRRETSLPYRVDSPKADNWFDCGVVPVRVRISDHPASGSTMADLQLVLARHHSHRNPDRGWFYFLCRFPGQSFTEEALVRKVLTSYRLRWKIEELHRQVKQDYGWERMQLAGYISLKNLNALLWVALAFLYSLKQDIVKLAQYFPRCIEPGKGWKALFGQFVFYRLYKVATLIFRDWRKYDNDPYRGRYHDQLQLRVNFL